MSTDASKTPLSPKDRIEAEYQKRLQEWEALKPHSAEVKVGGNHMTQKYYTERLLPVYITAIQKARMQDHGPWLFQEDGDPSHGIRKAGIASLRMRIGLRTSPTLRRALN